MKRLISQEIKRMAIPMVYSQMEKDTGADTIENRLSLSERVAL